MHASRPSQLLLGSASVVRFRYLNNVCGWVLRYLYLSRVCILIGVGQIVQTFFGIFCLSAEKS